MSYHEIKECLYTVIQRENEVIIKHLLKKESRIISMPRNQPVAEAAKLMKEHNVGSVVIKNEQILGIITKGDIINRVVGCALDPGIILVEDVMTHPIAYVSSDETLENCMLYMAKRNIERILVVENNDLSKPLGIVSTNDILKFAPGLMRIRLEQLLIENTTNELEYPKLKGFCDDCGNYSEFLNVTNGYTLCSDCIKANLEDDTSNEDLD